MKRVAGLLPLIPLLATWSLAQASDASSGERMNVLFLIIDDLNTWQLERAGRYAGKVVAPNIKRLAESGVNFTHAYTASPKCSPSRTAFLQGVAPWKSGHTDNALVLKDNPALEASTSFLQEFQEAGYFICQSGKVSHGYKMGINPDVSFKHSRDPAPPDAPFNATAKRRGKGVSERDWGPTHLDETDMNDYQKADAAIRALQMDHDRPFVITCGLFLPHMAWWIPQKYIDMYPLDEISLPPIKDDDLDDVPAAGRELISGTYETAIVNDQYRTAVQAYLGTTTFADAQIGRVLDALEASPYRDNTIVVLISDHGFHVGEKKHWQKGTLWEDGTNVLFSVRAPGITKPNQVSKAPVSLLDLYPTLMELTGLEIPEHVDGHSLVPLLKDVSTAHRYPVMTAYRDHIAIRTEEFRLICYGDGELELYDAAKDPNEWSNLAGEPEYRPVVEKLSSELPEFEMLPYVRKGKKKSE